MCTSIPNSHSIPPPQPKFVVNLSLFCKILNSFVPYLAMSCLSLAYFTYYDNLQVHPCCCKWGYFIQWPSTRHLLFFQSLIKNSPRSSSIIIMNSPNINIYFKLTWKSKGSVFPFFRIYLHNLVRKFEVGLLSSLYISTKCQFLWNEI